MREKHTILTHEAISYQRMWFFMKIRGDGGMYFCHGEIYVLDGPGILRLPRKLLIAKGAFVHSLILYIPAVCVYSGKTPPASASKFCN